MRDGRYERRELLGDGGMGEVWRGVDNELRRDVALKMPLQRLARDPMFVERFRREARAMAAVKHDNVIDIYDVCESADGPFIVMEYVEGGSLADLLRSREVLAPGETMSIIAQAARALEAAHRRGVIHRDVKPANLLLRHPDGDHHRPGGGFAVVLTDFGIARTQTASVLTQLNQNIGTATYMAPELFDGARASARSDIYALGIVAYECLAGRPPFRAERAIAVAAMHVTQAAEPLPPHVPPAVRAVVERAMAKRPEQRYASAAEFANAIDAAVVPRPAGTVHGSRPQVTVPAARAAPDDGPQPVRPAGPVREWAGEPTRIDVPRRRGRRRWLTAALAFVVGGGAAAAAAVNLDRHPESGTTTTAPGVPADLRAFAPNWPFEQCTRDDPPGEKQQERWRCPIDASTSLYLIRYLPGEHRDAKRADNDRMKPVAGAVALKRGTATAPGGTPGFYREYEVNVGSAAKPDWIDQIWFDNHPVQDPPLTLILRTKRTPDTEQALGRIRGLWDAAGYSRPR